MLFVDTAISNPGMIVRTYPLSAAPLCALPRRSARPYRLVPVRPSYSIVTLAARQAAALFISAGAINLANSRVGISVRSACAAAPAPAFAS